MFAPLQAVEVQRISAQWLRSPSIPAETRAKEGLRKAYLRGLFMAVLGSMTIDSQRGL